MVLMDYVAAGAELGSVACLIHLWLKARGSIVRKALWSPVVLIPMLGPLLYGGAYHPPAVHAVNDGQDDLDDINTDLPT